MKKITALLSFIFLFSFYAKAISAPLLSDEIPQEYINLVRKTPPVRTSVQDISDYDKATSIVVKVHSPENIQYKFQKRYDNYILYMDVCNIKRNDTFTLLVSEDVYKNGKLFIKKGTPAVGVMVSANLTNSIEAAPLEFRLTNFKTKDVNNNDIKLLGSILNDFTNLLQPSATNALKKNKVYKLYYK